MKTAIYLASKSERNGAESIMNHQISVNLTKLVLCLSLLGGFFITQAAAQCFPAYSQENFRKVYRNNKMFLVDVTDLTGDGKPDAYGYELQANNTFKNLVILSNNGSGGFGDPVIINTAFPIRRGGLPRRFSGGGIFYQSVIAGDLNGDGKKDLTVLADTAPVAVFTFLNNGKGSFTQSGPTVVGEFDYLFGVADMNSDGRADLLSASFSFSPSPFSYRPGNPDGTFGSPIQIINNTFYPVVGDFNADGKTDFAHLWQDNNHILYLKVLINLGGGVFTPTDIPNVPIAPVGVADMNGDGKLDIWGSGGIYLNDGSGNFTFSVMPAAPAPEFPETQFDNGDIPAFLMDIEGDGDKDIVLMREARQMQAPSTILKRYYSVYTNDSAGQLTKNLMLRPFPGVPADMNGDGKDEHVMFVNSTNQVIMASPTNETAVIVKENTCAAPLLPGQTKLIDFTGDGVSDQVLWKASTGIWRYASSNTNERIFSWGGSAFGDKPAPADFDGDGKTDAAVFRDPTGDWWILKSSDGLYISTHFGLAGDIPVPGDYDGDRKADIAVFRPSDGNWYIWLSGNASYLFLHFGTDGDAPVPADFDGDGKDNIAVFRPSTGEWYYMTSTFDNFVGMHWGMAGDQPVPADYDMDGKADITVYRQSDNYWYIYRSYDGGFNFIKFGSDHELPMAVDANGDGVMEIGTFRQAGINCDLNPECPGKWLTKSHFDYNWNLPLWGIYGVQGETAMRLRLPN